MKNRTLRLGSGRTIRLTALEQHAVYSGLLEGLPTREMNAATINDLLRRVRARTGYAPFLIEPTQTPIAYDGRYPFGEPAELPPIACVADFASDGIDPMYFSWLTVIWFQHDYAFPLAPEAGAALVTLDWDKLAVQREV